MEVLIDNKISIEKWGILISKSPYSSAFQTHEFYELFNSVPGHAAKVFAVEENSDIIALCVVTLQKDPGIKGYFSRRAIIYGGPVLDNANKIHLDILLKAIHKEFKHKAIYTEIRNLSDYSHWETVFQSNNWAYLPYQNFHVNCSDRDQMYQRTSSNRKRQIKKALKSNVIIKEAENLSEVVEFYAILKQLYKKKIKKPLFQKQFFEVFFNQKTIKYLLVIWQEKVIGGIMCLILEGKSIYEFYICGLDEEYKEQYPSVMATWAAMEYATQNGIRIFDFMGAGRKDQDYGVREFKARFGGDLVEHGRFLKVLNPFLYNLGKFCLKIFKVIR